MNKIRKIIGLEDSLLSDEDSWRKNLLFKAGKKFVDRELLWLIILKYLDDNSQTYSDLKTTIRNEWVNPNPGAFKFCLWMMKRAKYVTESKGGYYEITTEGRNVFTVGLTYLESLISKLE